MCEIGIEIPDEILLEGPYEYQPYPLYPESEEDVTEL
jgi:hypothetical protein